MTVGKSSWRRGEDKTAGGEEAKDQSLQVAGHVGCGYFEIITRWVRNRVRVSGREIRAETMEKRQAAPWGQP